MASSVKSNAKSFAGILYVERRFTEKGAELGRVCFRGTFIEEGFAYSDLCCKKEMSAEDIYQVMEGHLSGYIDPGTPFTEKDRELKSSITMIYPIFLSRLYTEMYQSLNSLLEELSDNSHSGMFQAVADFIASRSRLPSGQPLGLDDLLWSLVCEVGKVIGGISPLIPYGKSEMDMRATPKVSKKRKKEVV